MTQQSQNEWTKCFEGKKEEAIWRVMPPADLPLPELAQFKNAQANAAAIARTTEQAARVSNLEAGLARAAKQIGTDKPEAKQTLGAEEPRVASALPPLVIPTGPVDTLLEKQIAACAGLI